MEYIPWTRNGSGHWISNGFVFTSKGVKNGTRYLQCKTKYCDGKANIKDNQIRHTGQHFHQPDPLEVEILRSKQFMSDQAQQGLAAPALIYRRSVRRFPQASHFLTFPSSRRMMKHLRRKLVPPIPHSLQGVVEILNNPQWESWRKDLNGIHYFFRGFIEGPDNSVAIFLLHETVKVHLLRHAVMLLADATFKSVPILEGAYQLFIIHSVIREEAHPRVVPAAFFVMSNKSRVAYDSIIEALQQEVGHIVPASVMCDFEEALRESFDDAFPGLQVVSCWFHFAQAVRRRAGKLRLFPLMAENENASRIVSRVRALPLLPAQHMAARFQAIRQFAADVNLAGRFLEFFNYVEEQWFVNVNPADYSVYRHEVRTNNSVERYHLALKEAVGTHPSFWAFYDCLREMCEETHAKQEQFNNGLKDRKDQDAGTKRLHENIERLWNRLDGLPGFEPMTPEEFIAAAGHLINLPLVQQAP